MSKVHNEDSKQIEENMREKKGTPSLYEYWNYWKKLNNINEDDYAWRWHEGQRRRLYVITEDNSLSRCFFSLILNSILFLNIFTFSGYKSGEWNG